MNKKVVAGAIATITAITGFVAIKSGKVQFPVPYYVAKRVIDGDTFVTKEDQHIRLSSIDAPDLQYCLGKEAKSELEKLVLGKKIY